MAKKKYTDTDRATTRDAFIKHEGNIDATYNAINRKVTKRTISEWSNMYGWGEIVAEVRNKLVAKYTENEDTRREANLTLLRFAKNRLALHLNGQVDKDTKRVVHKAVEAKSAEGCVNALCEILRVENELYGAGVRTPERAERFTPDFLFEGLRLAAELKRADDDRQKQQTVRKPDNGNGSVQ